MNELADLYQELIVDHSRRPRNFRCGNRDSRHAEGYNPLCGDRVTVYATLENGVVKDVCFQGSGCAISTASASLLTEAIRGKTKEEAERIFEEFHKLITQGLEAVPDLEAMGKLAVFSGVGQYPSRVKCATLAWHTLKAALNNESQPVSTE
jgi:nitrogen fixation protein NifU and related proteins